MSLPGFCVFWQTISVRNFRIWVMLVFCMTCSIPKPLEIGLKIYAANFIAQISCVGKQGKLSGPCLSTFYHFGLTQLSETFMSYGYLHIFLTK